MFHITRVQVVIVFLVSVFAVEAECRFPRQIDLSQTSADLEIAGTYAGDHSGNSLTTGDINGDGIVDLVVASHYAKPLGGARNGEVEIIWGASLDGTGFLDMADPSVPLSRVFGRSSDNPWLARLACGDFNNDGCDDIIYALPYSLTIYADGMAYVIFGSPDFPDTLDLQTNPPNVIRILGAEYGGSVGWAACAGDLDGDGYDDIILSAPRVEYGEVYVIWGGETFLPVYDLGQVPPGLTRIIDRIIHNWTGVSLACKNINKDLYDDLLIGSEGPFGEFQPGMASLLYGQEEFPDTVLLSDAAFRIKNFYGEPYGDGRLGMHVAVGDMDHDGNEDLVLAAPAADPLGCEDCGEVYVLCHANQLPDSVYVGSADLPITRLLGGRRWYYYGVRVLCADFTGDQFDEVVVVSFGNNTSPNQLATTAIVYGQWAFRDSIFLDSDTTLTRINDAAIDDYLGSGVAVADFNRDGVNDLALGAEWADALSRNAAGKTYILHGSASATGIASRPPAGTLSLLQNHPNPFGTSTTIGYELEVASPVRITIYDIAGRRVAEMDMPLQTMGRHVTTWNGIDAEGHRVASGIYFYRLQAGGVDQSKKMILVR